MDVFVARQPIFDKQQKTYGYELLFRNSLDNLFPDIDGDTASSTVLSNSFLGIGVEKLTDGKKAFINFTRNLLLRQVPCLFSPDILYSELLESIEPDADILAAIADMSRKGCRFALDDFVFHRKYEPLFRYADIIKIDIRQTPLQEATSLIRRLKKDSVKFLAEKVETQEEYAGALAAGFSYFQGYFFSKPEIIKKRSIAPGKIRLLQIIAELNQEDADVNRLETIFKSDVSLTYRLLKYMNSAFFSFAEKITSVKSAIVYLGLNEVRKIVTLLITAKIAESKPNELIRTSVIRARLCELLGQAGGFRGESSELFLLGLFSLMDAILDMEMEQVVGQLPVSTALKSALIDHEGELFDYIELVRCFEQGRWEECGRLNESCQQVKLTVDKYMEAIGWANDFFV